MARPANSINKLKDSSNVTHEIVPHRMTDGSHVFSLPTGVTADAVLATQEYVLQAIENAIILALNTPIGGAGSDTY